MWSQWCSPICQRTEVFGECTRGGENFCVPELGCDVPKDVPCNFECAVQKVVITRKRQHAPMLGWLTGHQELLFVALIPGGNKEKAQKTITGIQQDNEGSQEVWVWGDTVKAPDGQLKRSGAPLVFRGVSPTTEFTLLVLGSHKDWSNGTVPLEHVAEARFCIDDEVQRAIMANCALSLPLLHDGRVKGLATLSVDARRSDGWRTWKPPSQDATPLSRRDRLLRLKGHTDCVTGCAVFPDGKRLLTVSKDKVGIIWSNSGEQLAWLHGHTDEIASCAVFASGTALMTVGIDGIAIIWSSAGQRLFTLDGVWMCAMYPATDCVLVALGFQHAAIYSSTGEQLALMRGHIQKVSCGVVFPSEERVITGSLDEDAILWDSQGSTLRVLRGHAGAITACAVFPSGDRVLTASADKSAIIWSAAGERRELGRQLAVLRGHAQSICCCAVMPTGERLVTASEDKLCIVWSATGERLADLRGHRECIVSCSVFLSGDRVLTVSDDRLGILWSTDGHRVGDLHGHSDKLCSCAVFPSGEHVVTTSHDMTAIVWPVAAIVNGGGNHLNKV
mmetsp:Transcript_69021/g.127209  ORF Transcript_69021/g.127209 Transcript_69021/m.127209 type:complete len:561 (-) Transcript_69021:16-1698(-)